MWVVWVRNCPCWTHQPRIYVSIYLVRSLFNSYLVRLVFQTEYNAAKMYIIIGGGHLKPEFVFVTNKQFSKLNGMNGVFRPHLCTYTLNWARRTIHQFSSNSASNSVAHELSQESRDECVCTRVEHINREIPLWHHPVVWLGLLRQTDILLTERKSIQTYLS